MNDQQITPIEFELPTKGEERDGLQFGWSHILFLLLGLFALLFALFITFSKSIEVRGVAQNLKLETEFVPIQTDKTISGILKLPIGNRVLVLAGERSVTLKADGFQTLQQDIAVGAARNQRFDLQMTRLPGKLKVEVRDENGLPLQASLTIDGTMQSEVPGQIDEIDAGLREVAIDAPLYRSQTQTILVRGKEHLEELAVELEPAWAEYTLSSSPEGAAILVDGEELAVTPANIKLEEGTRNLQISFDKYQSFIKEVSVVAQQNVIVPNIELKKARGRLAISSQPEGAAVILNDQYRGNTPLQLSLQAEAPHKLELYKAGYQLTKREYNFEPAQEIEEIINLDSDLVPISLSVSPATAEVYVDGSLVGKGSRTLNLSTLPHSISIRKKGYISQNYDLIPTRGNSQVISANLLTIEQDYWRRLPDKYTNGNGHNMVLFKNPGEVIMGSSRREDGRRANESQYVANLKRPFYVATLETTNRQFREFRAQHNSGNYKGRSLNSNRVPVVNISWQDAARYCNWLSKKEGLDPFYRTVNGFIAEFNEGANGYRLLTEVEWAWLARNQDGEVKTYAWGNAKHPGERKIGNYAGDQTVNTIKFRLPDYDDGYAGPSPVGKFAANHRGIYDLDGNAAEWVNDWYSAKGNQDGRKVDPLGPEIGEFHVIRGASWARGYLPQLRLAYRDYGAKGKHDVGFRIARYAGLNKQ